MKWTMFWGASVFLGVAGCNSPATTQAPPKVLVDLGDPLKTPDAPLLVPFKNIRKISQPSAPNYPAGARANRIHGDVLVELWINEAGVPYKSGALFGPRELHQCAIDYILTWRFSPYLANGTAIPVRTRMVMPFTLRDGGPYQAIPKGLVY